MAASPAAMAASLMVPLALACPRASAETDRSARSEAREPGRDATGERLRPRRLVMTVGEGEWRARSEEGGTVEMSRMWKAGVTSPLMSAVSLSIAVFVAATVDESS